MNRHGISHKIFHIKEYEMGKFVLPHRAPDAKTFTFRSEPLGTEAGHYRVFRSTGSADCPWTPWLVVKESAFLNSLGFSGLGLYADSDFPKGAWIGRYTGRVLSSTKTDPEKKVDELAWKVGRGAYLINILGVTVDGSRPPQSREGQMSATGYSRATYGEHDINAWPNPFLHIVNDPRGSRLEANMDVSAGGFGHTTKKVKKGTELLWNYGDEYWVSHEKYGDRVPSAAGDARLVRNDGAGPSRPSGDARQERNDGAGPSRPAGSGAGLKRSRVKKTTIPPDFFARVVLRAARSPRGSASRSNTRSEANSRRRSRTGGSKTPSFNGSKATRSASAGRRAASLQDSERTVSDRIRSASLGKEPVSSGFFSSRNAATEASSNRRPLSARSNTPRSKAAQSRSASKQAASLHDSERTVSDRIRSASRDTVRVSSGFFSSRNTASDANSNRRQPPARSNSPRSKAPQSLSSASAGKRATSLQSSKRTVSGRVGSVSARAKVVSPARSSSSSSLQIGNASRWLSAATSKRKPERGLFGTAEDWEAARKRRRR